MAANLSEKEKSRQENFPKAGLGILPVSDNLASMTTVNPNANRVRELRKRQRPKMTLTALGKLLHLSTGEVSKIERGERPLKQHHIAQLCAIFRVTPNDLLERTAVPQGMAESDAAPYEGRDGLVLAEQLYPGRHHTFVMRIGSDAMILAGIRAGDFVAVDPQAQPTTGEAVIIQHYDDELGSAETLVREFQPPWALARSPSERHQPVRLDDPQILVRGVIKARWSRPNHETAA